MTIWEIIDHMKDYPQNARVITSQGESVVWTKTEPSQDEPGITFILVLEGDDVA